MFICTERFTWHKLVANTHTELIVWSCFRLLRASTSTRNAPSPATFLSEDASSLAPFSRWRWPELWLFVEITFTSSKNTTGSWLAYQILVYFLKSKVMEEVLFFWTLRSIDFCDPVSSLSKCSSRLCADWGSNGEYSKALILSFWVEAVSC